MNNSFPQIPTTLSLSNVLFFQRILQYIFYCVLNLLLISDNQFDSLAAYRLNRIKQRESFLYATTREFES